MKEQRMLDKCLTIVNEWWNDNDREDNYCAIDFNRLIDAQNVSDFLKSNNFLCSIRKARSLFIVVTTSKIENN